MQWYYTRQGSQQGPVSEDDLRNLVRWGQLSPLDLVWNSRMGNRWAPVSAVDFLQNTRSDAHGDHSGNSSGDTPNHHLMLLARSSLQGNWGLAALVILISWSILHLTHLLRPLVHPFDFMGRIMAEAQPSSITILRGIALVMILLAAFLLTGPLSIGIKKFFLNLARGERGRVGDLFAGFQNGSGYYWRTVWVPLIIVMLVTGWAMAALIPAGILGYEYLSFTKTTLQSHDTRVLFAILGGIIALFVLLKACNYSMAGYLLADDPSLGAWEAVLKSAGMMKGCVWKFSCLGFRFLGWILLLPLTLGLGALLLLPYIATSVAHFYDDVKGRADNPETGV